MNTARMNSLVHRQRELKEELNRLVDRRSEMKTVAERLTVIPEAVRITAALREVDLEITIEESGNHDQ